MQTADVICPCTQKYLQRRHPTEASFEYFEQNPGSVEVDGNFAINFSWASASFSSDEMCGKGSNLEEHTGSYGENEEWHSRSQVMQILRRAVTLEEKKGNYCWEGFLQRRRRFHERMWKNVVSVAGSMIERVKLWGGENTSAFTSLKRRMKNWVFPNFRRVWIGGKAMWWLFFHTDVSLGLSSKGRICLAFQICPLISVSEESYPSPQKEKATSEKANSGQEWSASPGWSRAAALHWHRHWYNPSPGPRAAFFSSFLKKYSTVSKLIQ